MKDYTNEYEQLRSIRDKNGNRVNMVSVSKDGQVRWHWSDGAVTPENFKRSLFFDVCYKIIKFLRSRLFKFVFGFIITVFIAVVIALSIYTIVYYSVFK